MLGREFHRLAGKSLIKNQLEDELQKKALASREQRQKDFDGFVTQLKDLSKSDKPSECGLQTWIACLY